MFELIEQFSRGDFKTIRGVRIIRVFELIGNLLYIATGDLVIGEPSDASRQSRLLTQSWNPVYGTW